VIASDQADAPESANIPDVPAPVGVPTNEVAEAVAPLFTNPLISHIFETPLDTRAITIPLNPKVELFGRTMLFVEEVGF
jgi:hypothetical protein